MKKGFEKGLLIVSSIMLLFSVSMILIENTRSRDITGYDISAITVSNVTIAEYIAVSMSNNLSQGILFGTVNALPTDNQNATHNFDGESSASTMAINVSSDSNVAVDFCIKANTGLTTSGGIEILIGNETYSNATVTDADVPGVANETAITTDYAKTGLNVQRGNGLYYRFWLDLPASTSAGAYNNTISFKGVKTTNPC